MELKYKTLAILLFGLSFSANAETISKSLLDSLRTIPENHGVNAQAYEKDTILYFWATWCPDCKDKLTKIFNDSKIYEDFNVHLVATDKDLKKVQHYQKKNSIQPYIVTDESKDLQKTLGIYSVPTFVRLRSTKEGYVIIHKQSGGSIDQLFLKNKGI